MSARGALLLAVALGCSSPEPQTAQVDESAHTRFLPDDDCAPCHLRQVEAFQASTMHYAGFSPVFASLTEALTENHPEVPALAEGFCSGCHSPTDEAASITCDFCHRVQRVDGVANMGLTATPGAVKGGPFADPVPNGFHHSERAEHVTDAAFCGGCHDVRLPLPDVVAEEPFARLENLFTEWRESPWAKADHVQNPLRGQGGVGALHRRASGEQVTCQDCHMSLYPERRFDEDVDLGAFEGVDPATLTRKAHKLYAAGVAAVLPDVALPRRRMSNHGFAGGSEPMVPFPVGAPRNEDVRSARTAMLQAAVTLALDETPAQAARGGDFEVRAWLENVGAGHNVPAGFSQEREVWVELVVHDEGRVCAQDGDCRDLVERRRFVDDRPLECEVDDPIVTGDDGTRDDRSRRERSGVCDRARGRCVVYRSGYLADEVSDLRHELVDLDPETLDERCVVPGPDADQRPQGIDQGLVWFTNQFQAVAVDDAGAAVVHPQAIALEPTAAPYVPPPDAPPVLEQPASERRSLYATQRALQSRVRYRAARLGHPPAVTDPLRANRFFNTHALRPFEPRLARYQLPVPDAAVGPLRVSARLRYRFLPPRLVRALAARDPERVDEEMLTRHLLTVDMARAETMIDVVE